MNPCCFNGVLNPRVWLLKDSTNSGSVVENRSAPACLPGATAFAVGDRNKQGEEQ